MTTIPRKLIIWFDRLDLTYSIRNLTRDLANGFIIAEILSRYYPKEIKVYQFYNGLNLEKKRDNWERIAKFMEKQGRKIDRSEWEPVMHFAKGAALELVKSLYFFFEKEQIVETQKKQSKAQPYYMKPTASLRMKDNELCRIVDDQARFAEKVEVLKFHYARGRVDRQKLNLDEFINKQKQRMLEENAKKLFVSQRKFRNAEPQQKEPKLITLKNLEGTKKKSKEDATSLDSNQLIETLNGLVLGMIERDEEHNFQNNLPPLEKNEILFIHAMGNTFEYPVIFIQKLIQTLGKNYQDIKDGLANSYGDYKTFMQLMIQLLENLESNTQIYAEFLGFLELVGGALVEEQPDVCSLYMESAGLDLIHHMTQRTQGKRDGLAHLIVSFTPRTSNARSRLLEKLSDRYKSDLKNLGSLLAHLSGYSIEDRMDAGIFDFYWYKAVKIISYSYPTMKCCGVKILSDISKFNISKLHLYLPQINRLADEDWWEIKAQILIFCANQLDYVQGGSAGDFGTDAVKEGSQQSSQGRAHRARIDSFGDEEDHSEDHSATFNASSSGNQNRSQESRPFDQGAFDEIKDKYVESLIEIVQKIFHRHQNVNVLKVGLIYLARVLNFYPQLCEVFLEVLLNINEEIKKTILNTEEGVETKSNIVLSSNSFKYVQSGAPLNWNSSGLAKALESRVRAEDLASFDLSHIEILEGCLIQEIRTEEKGVWLEIYRSLQKYIFVSLAAPEQCQIASHIIKKIFLNRDIGEDVMEQSKELFLRILELVYQPDIDQTCKENMLDLFQFLVSEGDRNKEYVFQIIKRFSEKSHRRFLGTNVVNFMNDLARERRNRLYADTNIPTLSF